MCKVFFLLRSVGRRDLAAGPEQKNTTRVFFWCSGPGERQGKEKPRWAPARGQSKKKKHHPGCFFFAAAPAKGKGRRSPVGRRHGARAKKKRTPWVVFFFALGFSFPCLSPGPEQKKKNTLGGVSFLLPPRADAHSLTAGLGGDASPSPGWCFFFLLRPRPDRGGVFFLCCGPARTLTPLTVGWGDFGKARMVSFFLLRPRRVFLDNNKKCLGYYIGSKKTRRGHSKKKNTTSTLNLALNPKTETLKPRVGVAGSFEVQGLMG